ncbi:MAG: nuclear transport factor 2 family protein [Novosphingobium sp.]
MNDDLLRRLDAESAIRRLVGLYCDAVNRRDADAAGALFAPDCSIRIADGPERIGRDVQTQGMRQTFAAFAFLRQQCDVGLIDVDGDTARARLSVFEASHRAGEDGMSLIFGFYEDEYARLAEGWRFARRRYVLQFRSQVPVNRLQLVEGLNLGFDFAP